MQPATARHPRLHHQGSWSRRAACACSCACVRVCVSACTPALTPTYTLSHPLHKPSPSPTSLQAPPSIAAWCGVRSPAPAAPPSWHGVPGGGVLCSIPSFFPATGTATRAFEATIFELYENFAIKKNWARSRLPLGSGARRRAERGERDPKHIAPAQARDFERDNVLLRAPASPTSAFGRV